MRHDVGLLPIWFGSQIEPIFELANFAFEVDDFGLIRMAEREVAARMISAYADDGYNFITSPPGASDWGNALAMKSINGLLATLGSVEGLKVLEVGGGTLWSAERLISDFGARSVTIIDPALKGLEAKDQRITIRPEYLTPDTIFPDDFDLIISFNTLEHVPDPVSFLTVIRSHLSSGARLYLKLPESGKSFMMGDVGLCVHEHLTYFTPASLDAMLARAGLRRLAEAHYPGALQLLAEPVRPDLNAFAMDGEDLLTTFATRSVENIEHFISELAGGEDVAFVGASVGLANVLHLASARQCPGITIYDNDDLKHGQFLPGIPQKIRAVDIKKLNTARKVFVTPVNFYEEIKSGLIEGGIEDNKVVPVIKYASHT